MGTDLFASSGILTFAETAARLHRASTELGISSTLVLRVVAYPDRDAWAPYAASLRLSEVAPRQTFRTCHSELHVGALRIQFNSWGNGRC